MWYPSLRLHRAGGVRFSPKQDGECATFAGPFDGSIRWARTGFKIVFNEPFAEEMEAIEWLFGAGGIIEENRYRMTIEGPNWWVVEAFVGPLRPRE